MSGLSGLVLPGDVVPNISKSSLKLGPGLLQLPSTSSYRDIISTRAGLLNQTANGTSFWVESNSRRVRFGLGKCVVSPCLILFCQYVPAAQEAVIGVVTARAGGGEAYRVDIGSAHPAQLDGLAFEGATKRNRPNLKVISLYYYGVEDMVDYGLML
jgi:exosome complex component RRP40